MPTCYDYDYTLSPKLASRTDVARPRLTASWWPRLWRTDHSGNTSYFDHLAHTVEHLMAGPCRMCTEHLHSTIYRTTEPVNPAAAAARDRLLVEPYVERADGTLRNEFAQRFEMLEINPSTTSSHSHPKAAADRNAAQYSIEQFVHTTGMRAYHTRASNRATTGAHAYTDLRDFGHPVEFIPPGDNDIIVSIDNDYKHGIDWYGQFGRPIILYTFQPRQLYGRHANATYNILANGQVEYRVDGGAIYRHDIWNWSADHVAFRAWDPTIKNESELLTERPRDVIGCSDATRQREKLTRHWIYTIETREQPDDHIIVLLTPLALVPTWAIASYGERFGNHPAARRDFLRNGFAVQEYIDDEGLMQTSIVRPGAYGGATVPTELLNGIIERARADGIKSCASAETFMLAAGVNKSHAMTAAGFLREYVANYALSKPFEFRTRTGAVRSAHYTTRVADDDRNETDPDERPFGRNLTPAIVEDPDALPTRNNNNSVTAVVNRVEKVLNNVRPPNKYNAWAVEFVALTAGDAKMLPWTIDQVLEWQKLPTQRARNDAVHQFLAAERLRVQAFLKAEPVAGYGDPRNISKLQTSHVLRLSRFTLAAKQQLKKQAWYAPGLSPSVIANRLAKYGRLRGIICEADGARFDGRVSKWLTDNVVRAFYLQMTPACDRREMQALFDAEAKATTRTAERKKYRAGGSRLSGSPFTTDGNTLISAFIDYCANREQYEKMEAWDRLGLYAGDDMISFQDPLTLATTSKALGMLHECILREVGDFTTFLGRVYPRLHAGDPSSFQDAKRTHRRIHLSMAGKLVSTPDAAFTKGTSFLAIDPNQPVTAAYCRALIRAAVHAGGKWNDANYDDMPYVLREAVREGHDPAWPQDSITIEDVGAWTGVEVGLLQDLIDFLDTVQTFDDFEQLVPLPANVTVKNDTAVTIDGDAFTPTPSARWRDWCDDSDDECDHAPDDCDCSDEPAELAPTPDSPPHKRARSEVEHRPVSPDFSAIDQRTKQAIDDAMTPGPSRAEKLAALEQRCKNVTITRPAAPRGQTWTRSARQSKPRLSRPAAHALPPLDFVVAQMTADALADSQRDVGARLADLRLA